MKVLLTGASGFIGGEVARSLSSCGYEVISLDRSPPHHVSRFVSADLAELPPQIGSRIGDCDAVIHCAAELSDSSRVHLVNCEGTRQLCRAMEGRTGRWVQLSSIAVYGHLPGANIDENQPFAPASPYGHSKLCAERALQDRCAEAGISLAIVRPTNVFGDSMRSKALDSLARAIRRGWFCYMGSAGAVANYIHIDDVVSGLIESARNNSARGGFILSDDQELTTFINCFADAMGVPRPQYRIPEALARGLAGVFGWVPGFPLNRGRVDALTSRCRYSSGRAMEELQWQVNTGIAAGVARYVKARCPT